MTRSSSESDTDEGEQGVCVVRMVIAELTRAIQRKFTAERRDSTASH